MTQKSPEKESAAGASAEFEKCLGSGRFTVTAEVTPPVSTDPGEFIRRALTLKGLATAVNITDGAVAKAHMSSLVAAHFLIRNGIEPILQMTCRDRNRIALQSDLLGALALGVRAVLVLHGDDPRAGEQPEARAVHDYDTRQLLAVAHQIRLEQKLPSGAAVHGAVKLMLGAADTPVDPPPDWIPRRLMEKMATGADFIQTQFCMDMGVVRRYAARLIDLGIAQKLPILIGVAPLPSARSARWMREKLFGTLIPEDIVRRLERAADPKREGKAICVEILQQLAATPGIAGAHIMAPQFFSAVPEVIAASGVTGKKRAALPR